MNRRTMGALSAGIGGAMMGLALVGWTAPAQAQEPQEPPGTLSLVLENDSIAHTDRNYTNGARLSWVGAPGGAGSWAHAVADALPFMEPVGLSNAYALGQNMYTPEDTSAEAVVPDDRPYGGWLYAGFGLTSNTGDRLDQVELDLGIVGPQSYADEVQGWVHESLGFDVPNGWPNQLKNEPAVQLFFDRTWRVAHWDTGFLEMDLHPHLGGAVGNVFTFASTGASIRIGTDLPADFGPARIRPSLPGSGFIAPEDGFGWYLFAGATGRAVAHNIFLDGNTFVDSHSVDKKWLVGDLQAGATLMVDRFRLSYTHVFRTKEFETQDEADRFGAVTLSVNFRF